MSKRQLTQENKTKRMYRRDTRERIVQSALNLFATMDYHQVTIRKIAKKAEVKQAHIYRYFDSKDDLYVALCDMNSEELKKGLDTCIANGKTTLEKLKLVTRHFFNYADNNIPVMWLTYVSTTYRYLMHAEGSVNNARYLTKVFANILREGQKKGDVKSGINFKLISQLYFGGLRNIVIDWLNCGSKDKLVSLSDEVSENIYQLVKI